MTEWYKVGKDKATWIFMACSCVKTPEPPLADGGFTVYTDFTHLELSFYFLILHTSSSVRMDEEHLMYVLQTF